MVKTDLGKVAITYKGLYDSSYPYTINDEVRDNATNATYRSLKTNNISPLTDTTAWGVISRGIGTTTDNNFTDAEKEKVDNSVQLTQANIANGYVGIGSDGNINNTEFKTIKNGFNAHLADISPHGEIVTKTLYVSTTTGNDTTGDGSINNPYKTIQYTINTLKRTLFTEIKIRVLAGDYSSEGKLGLSNFSKRVITLTAFDGTNDIVTPNDNYIIYGVGVDSCDQLYIQGFKVEFTAPNDYSIYTVNTRDAHYIGLKMTYGNLVNYGFGIRYNSHVTLENCLISNKIVVASCNMDSKLVAKNFDVHSTGNNMGLWAHGGSIINRFGTQPSCTYPIINEEGSLIVSEAGLPETRYDTLFETSLTVTDSANTITIPLTFADTPKEIDIITIVDGSKQFSIGKWVKGTSFCMSRRYLDNCEMSTGTMIELDSGTGAYNVYYISSATKDSIVLSRNVSYTAMTTTMKLQVVCRC